MMFLQQFNFEITHWPEKTNSNADALSRAPEVSCYLMNIEYQKPSNKLLNPIIDESEIEWKCSDDSSHTILLKEEELVDWYFQRNICNKCGAPFKDLYAWGDLWNAPKLCNICSDCLKKWNSKGKGKRSNFLYKARQFAHVNVNRKRKKYIIQRNRR